MDIKDLDRDVHKTIIEDLIDEVGVVGVRDLMVEVCEWRAKTESVSNHIVWHVFAARLREVNLC